MYVDLRSSIGRGIFVKGSFDPVVFHPIARAFAGRSGVFVDVGANVGYYSVLAARLPGVEQVHAFDVDERPLRCLRRNATESRGRIVVHEVAIGESTGRCRLLAHAESGQTRTAQDSNGGVPMTTLDHWAKTACVERIVAIKIDIEGGELAALRGARQSLLQFKPEIVFELLPDVRELCGVDPADVFAFLDELGYAVERVGGALSPTFHARSVADA